MLTTLTALFSVLTSGAGGGLLGGVFGIFKHSQERKERVEMARINADLQEAKYRNDFERRQHDMRMLEKEGSIDLAKMAEQAKADMEVEYQRSLAKAQEALTGLSTNTAMDNYRASVRPTLAYWGAILFTLMLAWAFTEFGETIDKDTGRQILLGMFSTLTFIMTSVVTFYYVSRRNPAPILSQ